MISRHPSYLKLPPTDGTRHARSIRGYQMAISGDFLLTLSGNREKTEVARGELPVVRRGRATSGPQHLPKQLEGWRESDLRVDVQDATSRV